MKKHVEKEEEKKEEVVVESEEQNDYVPAPEPEPEPIVYKDEPLKEIELERQSFFKTFRIHNTLKWVITVVCIVALIVGLIVIPNAIPDNENLKTALMLVICIVAVVGTFGYSAFCKRYINSKMRRYFNFYYRKTAEFAFDQEGFGEPVVQEPGKIDIDFFKETNLYKDIISVGSRGLTEFSYNGIPMRIVECAGNIKDGARERPVFVGKLLHCAGKYLGEQAIVVYFKGNDRALPPTNITELKIIEDNEKYIVYSNSPEVKKIINKDIKKIMNTIDMNEYLVDLAISMHDGKLFVCFGYDDPLMVLPLQNQFNPKPNEQYKKDLGSVIKLVEALNK